jgi:hypothetical protein
MLKTWTIVIPVTLLIWVFAEAESLRSLNVPTSFAIRPPTDQRQVVDAVDDAGQPIPDGGASRRRTVSIEGPAAAIQRAENILREGITLTPGMGEFASSRGSRELDLAAVLRSYPPLQGLGVTIKSVDPPRIRVAVDDVVERKVGVVVELPDGQTDGPPVVSPPEVVMRIPSEAAAKLPDGAQAIAKIDRTTWDRLVPGRRESTQVAVQLPKALEGIRNVIITPARVTIDLTVRSRTDTLTIPTVPVHIRAPAAELERWDVQIKGRALLNDVKITGPADVIQRVRDGSITVVAFVPLSYEDLERRIASKEAIYFDLPTSLRFEPEAPLIELEITRREAVEPDVP